MKSILLALLTGCLALTLHAQDVTTTPPEAKRGIYYSKYILDPMLTKQELLQDAQTQLHALYAGTADKNALPKPEFDEDISKMVTPAVLASTKKSKTYDVQLVCLDVRTVLVQNIHGLVYIDYRVEGTIQGSAESSASPASWQLRSICFRAGNPKTALESVTIENKL